MDEERFEQLNEEITRLGMDTCGDFEEMQRRSKAIFERYGTSEAEYDRELKRRLKDLRRWRDSGFQENYKGKHRVKMVGFAITLMTALVIVVAFVVRC
jgi:hypothetical protein